MTFRLKRRAAPRSWTIPRKGTKWVKRPSPGPHPQDASVPLLQVLRDLRRIAHTSREAGILVRSGVVQVDGKVIKDLDRGIGLMDTVTFAAPLNESYRMVRNRRGKLVLVPIPSTEAATKIGRVRLKHTVRGGKVEVTLHDGRNLLVPANTAYKVGDSLRIELPAQKVSAHLQLAPGKLAYIVGGSHVGEVARVERIEVLNSPQPNRVHFKEGFSTVKEYVFIVGDQSPQVTLGEEGTQ